MNFGTMFLGCSAVGIFMSSAFLNEKDPGKNLRNGIILGLSSAIAAALCGFY